MPMSSFAARFLYRASLATGFVLLVLLLSCNKSTDPDTKKPPDNTTIGVLLSGNDGDNAVGQTVDFMATIPTVIMTDTSGVVANKIFVVVSPSATVGQVNRLLDSMQARIICMDDASVFLTLSIPALSAVEDIDSVTARLAESEPLLFAFPCYVPIPPTPAEPDPELLLKDIPGDPAAGNIAHLKACYMPAAWNANSRANQVNSQVTVLVPDAYAQLSPHAELPGQEFVAIPGDGADVRVDAGSNTALGNHGFYVSGILGAKFDDIGATGIHPGNASLIKIRSLNVGSEEWGAKLQQIADAIPSTSRTVVSTSLGYNDPTFSNVSKWERILLALKWRELIGDRQTQFVHATSSGNDGRVSGEGALSVYNSPFTMAAQMVSPWDWLGAGEYTAADSLGYVQLQELYANTKPYILQPLINTLVVGSSNQNGSRSAFSNLGADIRFVGERVFCPCVTNDATCIDGFGTPSGTSMAAPQAAGLATYLMNLKATLTPMQAKQVILSSYDNGKGIVNSYKAVLSLDDGLSNADVRKAILNVADTTAGTFDEKDIEAFLNVIDEPQYIRDYSRFDLNGDGWTGGATTAAFDLDINTPPAFSTVSIFPCDEPTAEDTTFDENVVKDRDVLFYYAYSPLYTGNDSIRNELLGMSCTPYQTGNDSSFLWVYGGIPALGIKVSDTTVGGSLTIQADETRDSLTPICHDSVGLGYRFQYVAGGHSLLSSTVGLSDVSVTGEVSYISTSEATAPASPAPCQFDVGSGGRAYNSVDFSLNGEANFVPMTVVVNGLVNPVSSQDFSAMATCIIRLAVCDKTSGATYGEAFRFDSRIHTLPFEVSGVLGQLPDDRIYRVIIESYFVSGAMTQTEPGPYGASINLSMSLFVGE